MRYVFYAILASVLFVFLINKDLPGSLVGMNLWNSLRNNTGVASEISDADKKTEEFLKELEDKKEDLAYLDQQIDSLTEGLKEMPDRTQNKYFRDLLTKIQNKEDMLSRQIAQQKQVYEEHFLNSPSQKTISLSNMAEQNQQNTQDRMQRMDDMMESQRIRAQEQMQRMDQLMEENQMRMEDLMERTKELEEQNQLRQQD